MTNIRLEAVYDDLYWLISGYHSCNDHCQHQPDTRGLHAWPNMVYYTSDMLVTNTYFIHSASIPMVGLNTGKVQAELFQMQKYPKLQKYNLSVISILRFWVKTVPKPNTPLNFVREEDLHTGTYLNEFSLWILPRFPVQNWIWHCFSNIKITSR